METEHPQAFLAYLLGRAIAGESVIKTLMASRHQDVPKLIELVQTNLAQRKKFLERDLAELGLDPAVLPKVHEAFAATQKSATRGLSSGRFVPPDVQLRDHE